MYAQQSRLPLDRVGRTKRACTTQQASPSLLQHRVQPGRDFGRKRMALHRADHALSPRTASRHSATTRATAAAGPPSSRRSMKAWHRGTHRRINSITRRESRIDFLVHLAGCMQEAGPQSCGQVPCIPHSSSAVFWYDTNSSLSMRRHAPCLPP